VFAGARRFDRRIERQQIRLIGDIIDDAHDLFDRTRTSFERCHELLIVCRAVAQHLHGVRGLHDRVHPACGFSGRESRGGRERRAKRSRRGDLAVERADFADDRSYRNGLLLRSGRDLRRRIGERFKCDARTTELLRLLARALRNLFAGMRCGLDRVAGLTRGDGELGAG
jgi:hypothetical protein